MTLTLSLLMTLLTPQAQPRENIPRVGVLQPTSQAYPTPCLFAFQQRLRDLGYGEGQTLLFDYRYAEGHVDRICNDAGIGKDHSGIAGLEILNQADIPAASVAAMSARIGSDTSTYEHGLISHCNAVAQARGVRRGQPAKAACLALLRAYQGDR